jgi:DNA-binding transcriptional MerR regulator
MVVAVMGAQKSCPDDLSFSPMNYASLLKVDAFRRDVLEPPDWGFFFGVIMSFVGLIIITVLIVGYMFNRDWNQRWIPKVSYQVTNYQKAQNANPEDKRAIVSINTEAQSFLVRSGGGDLEAEEAEEAGLEAIMDADGGEAAFAARKSQKKMKKKDLTLRDVEGLKKDLGTHLKEIKKLFRTERDFEESSEEQSVVGSDEESSDAEYDRDLNIRIANVKKRLMHNANMLKGEGEDDGGEAYDELGLGGDDSAAYGDGQGDNSKDDLAI